MDGKALRLARLIKPSCKKTCIVPIDHGVTLGPIAGLGDYRKLIDQIISGGADGIVLHKGILKKLCQDEIFLEGNYILHLSASTKFNDDSNCKVLVGSVEEAVQLGADAVSIHVNLGDAGESSMLRDFGKVSEACARWGMPLLAMVYAKRSQRKQGDIAHTARLAEELGADLVKIESPETMEEMREVVKNVHIPVLVAGGENMNNPEKLLYMVNNSILAGAAGVAIGRNIFASKNPGLLIKLISMITHKEKGLDECIEILKNDCKCSSDTKVPVLF
ncbi:2-amino-3,7-dideoxy-D-threo-hept-6-ulosonate synthase [Ruminiclostridium josui]|uniref:2-amino-3,7-dideoxy-D-threo-hept-6-ulosonate synthase n=1 Tax=Ruminiclostridium josui TaxID=1499 RepID=UPI0004664314|nr:2-amino-3,7-dideoxy-D-threo-hept-6-ulosonate synthase [Ruminiclostridium josui]